MRSPGNILILGAGPTGLGAAFRLAEHGYERYTLYEANGYPGGLSCSFTDDNGFVWDIGGHVLFSHYGYFDNLMDSLIPPGGWVCHERESWVWVKGRFVPYPFQNNIARLPENDMRICLDGLAEASKNLGGADVPDFGSWILATFGGGIAEIFMLPYNRKVWAYPPEELSHTWIAERVSTPDLERVRGNIREGRDDTSWGPNNRFRFPLEGGTGSIWKALAERLPEGRLRMGKKAVSVDLAQKKVQFADGEEAAYDTLITTIPLDRFGGICKDMDETVGLSLAGLMHSSVHVIGVGFAGEVPEKLRTKCWMYFPESDCPFYRVTVFSNYSPNNVPVPGRYWSLMAEVSESSVSPVDGASVAEEVIRGMKATGLVPERAAPVTLWHYRSEYGNPTPSIGRDEIVDAALDYLESKGVYSRGRFGAWKYEVSNMDHSVMQGVELVDRLVTGRAETTLPVGRN